MKLTLYHYWRSSSSWRVRLGLQFKGVPFDLVPIDLLKNEQTSPEHLRRSPRGLVPSLEVNDGGQIRILNESSAILEFLEETFPLPSFLPVNPYDRAKVREITNLIACDIQPVQNLSVLNAISSDPEKRAEWSRTWISKGFAALEKIVSDVGDTHCFGNFLTMADFFFIPQAYNADRFNLDWTPYPLLKKIYADLKVTEIVRATAPEAFQPK